MIHRLLVLASVVCCALVVASFRLFARDQVAGASKHQVSELTSPFRSIVQSDSQWVLHGLPTLFALLVYGVRLGFLARYSRGVS